MENRVEGFVLRSSDIVDDVFIPKYYDPELISLIGRASNSNVELRSIGDLIGDGVLELLRGHDIGKDKYTGQIPYVRTSDVEAWTVVGLPKQGVEPDTFEYYQARQDVQAGDVLFVCDGLYRIGDAAVVTQYDLPMIHQSHLLRFRVHDAEVLTPELLVALLSTRFVRHQVRAKQFTAGIIDKIEHRFEEIVLPLPPRGKARKRLAAEAAGVVGVRIQAREAVRALPGAFDPSHANSRVLGHRATVGGNRGNVGFVVQSHDLAGEILIPSYYDDELKRLLAEYSQTYDMRSIGDLVATGHLAVSTGVEPGKMAYGTGPVPFVRTSDLVDLRVRTNPTHAISEQIYRELEASGACRAGDILLVRDGTYLVGQTALVQRHDVPALFAGGNYCLRPLQRDVLDEFVLLAALNSNVVRAQISARQFTRDVIDTLGRRLFEVEIPIPTDPSELDRIRDCVKSISTMRQDADERTRQLVQALDLAA